jgi:hypothetical protein
MEVNFGPWFFVGASGGDLHILVGLIFLSVGLYLEYTPRWCLYQTGVLFCHCFISCFFSFLLLLYISAPLLLTNNNMEKTCKKCGMAIDDTNTCSCEPETCANCCSCAEDCQCGCVEKRS